mmetsp:Transcript_35173/g.75101  ORF Transcript_35173/g.75101 Transcript_35173/m.75101 type:complete len:193 (-) Transcript_35173:576-1154(-)|eukprot:CAMPEP_0183354270 /NCGR_PEP_ID=MMETSP0164_2-20130417/37212_1 /TAXON_ID=221442 /ORGANISM="Coccolithus pelagicus ssp braarudi, Strain PLY182g" /LENGTH=192 /DNA_ID=CAMNT_0025527123 /DNA_START=72 /DNA_END=650 /DNA_ORIENTATION=+
MAAYRNYLESKGYAWAFEVEESECLDEGRPLVEELEIDFYDISRKVLWSMRPPSAGVGLVSDFWGPLLVILIYAALVVWGQLAVVSWVLSIWVCGGAIVFAMARVLGADTTLAHTLGSLGYCTVPLVISRLLQAVMFAGGSLSLLVRGVCLLWATYTASCWMRTQELERKRLLLAYPVFLYMFYLTALATGV